MARIEGAQRPRLGHGSRTKEGEAQKGVFRQAHQNPQNAIHNTVTDKQKEKGLVCPSPHMRLTPRIMRESLSPLSTLEK